MDTGYKKKLFPDTKKLLPESKKLDVDTKKFDVDTIKFDVDVPGVPIHCWSSDKDSCWMFEFESPAHIKNWVRNNHHEVCAVVVM